MKKIFHPEMKNLLVQLNNKKLDRREFVRYATLLGLSAAGAYRLAGFDANRALADAPEIVRGGVLKIASPVDHLEHPAKLAATEPANILRQVAEYLTITDNNNITHPYLLKNWRVSPDLKTWTLNLKKGITFHNGDELSADDVIFSFRQWLDKDAGTSMQGLLCNYLSASGIEKTGRYQIILHLDCPEMAVPEHLFHYPAVILNHRTFEGDFLKAPHGTGPYTLEEYKKHDRCILKRYGGYWQKDAYDRSLPYMDGMEFIQSEDLHDFISDLQAGKMDMANPAISNIMEVYKALKYDSRFVMQSIDTAGAYIVGMRCDMHPWSDNRVRTALKLCQDRRKISVITTSLNNGFLGQDFHVSPVHPEYSKKPIPEYNPVKARQMLKEAGYGNGITVTLDVQDNSRGAEAYAEILEHDAKSAGFSIKVNEMEHEEFNRSWHESPFIVLSWTGRPLGTMVLNLGYTVDKDNKPVPWNHTRWIDDEFNRLLNKANGTLDVTERRRIFDHLEQIQLERGSVGIACWQKAWLITSAKVKNARPHPSGYMLFNQVYLDWKNTGANPNQGILRR